MRVYYSPFTKKSVTYVKDNVAVLTVNFERVNQNIQRGLVQLLERSQNYWEFINSILNARHNYDVAFLQYDDVGTFYCVDSHDYDFRYFYVYMR